MDAVVSESEVFRASSYSILLSAYACEPGKGSEPGVGWHWAMYLAEAGHKVCVITRENNRALIEHELSIYPIPNLKFIYYDLPSWAKWWKKGGRGVYLYYLLWQLGIYRIAKNLAKEIHFDFSHHITFGVFRQPSFLPFLNIPFIFGPVGGGESASFKLRKGFPLRGYLIDGCRDIANAWAKIDPMMRLVYKRSTVILCKTKQTMACIPPSYHNKCKVRLEIGSNIFSPEDVYIESHPIRSHELHILYVGRLIYWKGLHLGIEAFARLLKKGINAKFTVIGQGPDAQHFRSLAQQLGIDHAIEWLPHMERSKVMEIYAQNDVFLFPSLHDSSGNVVLEALSCALPVVCLDLGGPGKIVNKGCGFKIQAQYTEQIIADLTQSLYVLAKNKVLWVEMRKAAVKRAVDYSWPNQIVQMEQVYAEHKQELSEEDRSCVLQS